MDNHVLQCLHHSKMMLMYAQKEEWEAFIALHPLWEEEVSHSILDKPPQASPVELESILVELIEDIDRIRELIKLRMTAIEQLLSLAMQQKKAIDSYLK